MKNEMKNIFSVLFTFVLLAGTLSAAQVTLYPGWNMITPNDDGLTESAISSACSQSGSIWHYDGQNYQRATGALEVGKGYWVRASSQCTINTNGNPYTVTSLSLNSGWNQIGISSSTGTYSSTSTCSIQGGPWYYDTSSNSYQRSSTSSLIAGKGYWVKVPSSCTLSFSDSPPQPPGDETSALNYISAYASPSTADANQYVDIIVYAYDNDGSYALPTEGTSVSAYVSGNTGYSLSNFAFSKNRYTATFSASQIGSYTIQITAIKNDLKKTGSTRITIKTPAQQPVEHYKGGSNAPVTIVEYSEFQCPFCSRVQPTLSQVLSTYGDQVKLVYKHYPLTSLHQNAQKAAEASECASDQGKFWEMHDAMYADQDRLSVSDLKATASRLGMNEAAFNTCLDSGTKASIVSANAQEGASAGVSGTPTFFINGEMIVGAQSYSSFQSIIDRLLGNPQKGEVLGSIAYWYGKVNQHKNPGGSWLTDSDGKSGADINQLTYCKKFFPSSLGVNEVGRTYIGNWKDAGNNGQYGEYGVEYECLSYSYYHVVTDLRPNQNEVGTATFTSTPSGANIVITQNGAGVAKGTTPYSVQLKYGYYSATYSLEGYSDYKFDFYFNERTHTYSKDMWALKPLGYIAYWYGKLNMHSSNSYNWQTDSDGTSGANIYQLEYCKKFFPDSKGFNETGREYINNWKDVNGNSHSGYGVEYACLPIVYTRAVTDLTPETPALDSISLDPHTDRMDAGSTMQVYLYAYDTDNSQATPDEGTSIASVASANGKQGYSLSAFQFSNNRYVATFSATQSGTYTLHTTVKKGDKELTATATVYVQPTHLGQIAYWSGKVNMHRALKGEWETDADGTSGANLDTLEYCKKFFPQATDATSNGNTYISGWKDYGNTGNYNNTGATYNCVASTYGG